MSVKGVRSPPERVRRYVNYVAQARDRSIWFGVRLASHASRVDSPFLLVQRNASPVNPAVFPSLTRHRARDVRRARRRSRNKECIRARNYRRVNLDRGSRVPRTRSRWVGRRSVPTVRLVDTRAMDRRNALSATLCLNCQRDVTFLSLPRSCSVGSD